MPPAPPKLHQLIERFDDNLAAYKQGHYNETQARREFVDPLFKLLGWDIDNDQGYAEAYKDVVHEDAIKVSGGTKAPDYGFRIGGVRKFFVEAKKPSVDIRNDVHPAYQLRRYAWSAKLPLSILTDFEELAVYDCRIKSDKGDKAATARVLYFKYTDHAEHWDEIAGIFRARRSSIDFTSPTDVARHDQMVALVERMLDLHKRVAAEQMPHVKTVLQRQIEATDRQIDLLVYELYGLTEEEIGVVESR